MSRIADTFEALTRQNHTALIPYLAAGDQKPEETVPLMHELVAAGADIIELGVPFSDPMADGKVIQLAYERALVYNTSLAMVLDMVADFRRKNGHTPIVLMGYQNPVEVMGTLQFARRAEKAGVDGLLTVDLPMEEADDTLPILLEHGIDPIFLLSPTTPEERVKCICKVASGFVYYVSLKGVTGAAHFDIDNVTERVKLIKQHTQLPVAVGFGVKDAKTASLLASVANAVVVGSALVEIIGQADTSFEERCSSMAGLLSAMHKSMRT